jgi:hypothetical protein
MDLALSHTSQLPQNACDLYLTKYKHACIEVIRVEDQINPSLVHDHDHDLASSSALDLVTLDIGMLAFPLYSFIMTTPTL